MNATLERMTALDAAFLHAENDSVPLHIGSLSWFEGEPFGQGPDGQFAIEAVRRRVSERLHLFPRFRQRVQTVPLGLGRPFWVDDDDFDITRHVRHRRVDPPGDEAAVVALCSELQMRPLDREHPLWELWFIDGLDDGRVALVEKLHHAMVDGVSGVEVAAALLDLRPDAEVEPGPPWTPPARPTTWEVVGAAVAEDLAQPAEVMRSMAALLGSPAEAVGRLRGAADALVAVLPGPGRSRPAPFIAPVGPQRQLRWVRRSLSAVKAAAHEREATTNDVVLAVVSGAVADLLTRRGEPPAAGATLHVLVPVSLRSSAPKLALGNRVTCMLATLPLEPLPIEERLRAVQREMSGLKRHHQALGNELLLEGADVLPSSVLAAASRLIHHQPLTDVVVTNVPGPACPLYFMGAQMTGSVPIVPLGGNLAVGIAVLSYDDELTIAMHADPDRCPDLDDLVVALDAHLTSLVGPA